MIVLFRDFFLPHPENGPGTQAGKERDLYCLQAHARNDVTFPPKPGENVLILEKDFLIKHSLFGVLLYWKHGVKCERGL